MVQKFRIPKYVNIWQSNANGDKGELLMEAQMGGRRRVGGNLLVRTVEPAPKGVDLGVNCLIDYICKRYTPNHIGI